MRGVLHLTQTALIKIYLRAARRIWRRLPVFLRSLPIFLPIGAHLHSWVLRFGDRKQNHSTFFLRNRAELELIRRLAGNAPQCRFEIEHGPLKLGAIDTDRLY